MSKESDFKTILLICTLLLFAPHAIFLYATLLFCLKKSRKLMIAGVILLIISILLVPSYLQSFLSDIISNIIALKESKISVITFLFSSISQYSVVGNLFLAHISFLLALVTKELGTPYEIKGLSANLNELKKEEAAMEKRLKKTTDEENRTVIGTYGKRQISTSDNARHIFVCGTTGSGKTVALSNYIESAIKKDYPLLIIDGKGDIGDNSLYDIVKRFQGNKKLYVIDMNNPEQSSKYNPFLKANPSVMKDMLINLTTWSEEHYKANAERYIQRLIALAAKLDLKPSFKTLISYMIPEKHLEMATTCYKEGKITKDEFKETAEIIKNSADIAVGASARFITIAESEVGVLFDETGIDIYEALKEKAIILFLLNPLLYPETSSMLGKLIMIDAKKAVSKLFKNKESRVFYLFDEISTYASPALIDLVNKSRSAGVTCILATQSLSDLDAIAGEAFKEQLIENCNNYIVMRQNSATNAENWSKILGTIEGLSVTYQIGEKDKSMVSTGLGSVRKERHFLYHPDDIKRLATGEAVYMSKDENVHFKIKIRKGF